MFRYRHIIISVLCGILLLAACRSEKDRSGGQQDTPEEETDVPVGMKRLYLRINADQEAAGLFSRDFSTKTVIVNGKNYTPVFNESRNAWYVDAEESSFDSYSAELISDGSENWYGMSPSSEVFIPSVQFLHKTSDLRSIPLMAEHDPDYGDFLDFVPPYGILLLEVSGMERVVSVRVTSSIPMAGTALWSRSKKEWSFSGNNSDVVLNCTEESSGSLFPVLIFGRNPGVLSVRICDDTHKAREIDLGAIEVEPGRVVRKNINASPENGLLWFEGFDRCVWGGDAVGGKAGLAPSATPPTLDGDASLDGYEYALTEVPSSTPGSGYIQRSFTDGNKTVSEEHKMSDSYIESRGFSDNRFMLRCREHPGYISIGTSENKRGWFSLYPLQRCGMNTVKNVEVSFRICPGGATRDDIIFLVQGGVTAITGWSLDGAPGPSDAIVQRGNSDTLRFTPTLLQSGAWHDVRVRVDNCTDLTTLQWLGASFNDGTYGFYLDEIAVREIPGNWQKSGKVRLLYWNIQNGMWADQGENYDNFVAFVKKYDPDICVWCEAESRLKTGSDESWTSNRYLPDHWGELAARYGHGYCAVSRKDDFPQAVTSRYPVTLLQQLDSPLKHGAGIYKVETPSGNVYPLALHLKPNASDGTSLESERKDEMAYILSNSVLKPSLGISGWILVGDYNSTSRTDAAFYTKDEGYLVHDYIVANTSLKDLFATRYPGTFMYTTGSKRRIDYIYVDATAYSRVSDACVLTESWTDPKESGISTFWTPSDHRPILVDLQ